MGIFPVLLGVALWNIGVRKSFLCTKQGHFRSLSIALYIGLSGKYCHIADNGNSRFYRSPWPRWRVGFRKSTADSRSKQSGSIVSRPEATTMVLTSHKREARSSAMSSEALNIPSRIVVQAEIHMSHTHREMVGYLAARPETVTLPETEIMSEIEVVSTQTAPPSLAAWHVVLSVRPHLWVIRKLPRVFHFRPDKKW